VKILVDADACPVKPEILREAAERGIEVVLVANIHHQMPQGEGVSVVVVGDYEDEADFEIVKLSQPGDLVVTQDIGLAAMVVEKGARALSTRGRIFLREDMPHLLEMRYHAKQAMQRGKYPKPLKPFADHDRRRFLKALTSLLDQPAEGNAHEGA